MANGPVYNHPELIEPGDLNDTLFVNEGFSNNHSGVQQWYRWTISPTIPLPFGETACNGDQFALGKRPAGLDDSLNPCQRGWYWSLNPTAFPAPNGAALAGTRSDPLILLRTLTFGCQIEIIDSVTRVTCNEASSPFLKAEIDIPDQSSFLTFDYFIGNSGDGDYAAVLIDDSPIWILSGTSATLGQLVDSGAIPIAPGHHTLTIALYGVGEHNFHFSIQNLRAVSISSIESPIPISIDIKPGSFPNTISLKNQGTIPVAILSTRKFNAPSIVNPTSLTFGHTGIEKSLALCNSTPQDVNFDGLPDQICHFFAKQTGLVVGDSQAVLNGKTKEGKSITATASVRVIQ